jgi:hypothetical protein
MGETDFERLWAETKKMNGVEDLGLTIPDPPRRRSAPRRLGVLGGMALPAQLTVKEKLRKDFVSVLDWVR